MKLEDTKFSFLTASRFWAMIIGALSIYLQAKGYIGQPEMELIATITGLFIAVKTIDKNLGEVKENVTTVSMPNEVKSVSAKKGK